MTIGNRMVADAADERTTEILGASRTGRVLSAAVRTLSGAWAHSAVKRAYSSLIGADAVDDARFWAIVTLVASLVALAGGRFGTTPQPLGWLLPAIAAAIAAALLALAPTGGEAGHPSE